LVEKVGSKELWQTLKTTDPETAKREKAKVVARWRARFDALRRDHGVGNLPPLREPTEDDMRAMARRLYRDMLADDQSDRITAPTDTELEAERQKALQTVPGDPWAALDYLVMRDGPGANEARQRHLGSRPKAQRCDRANRNDRDGCRCLH
jgi:hypothetical protein